MTLPINPYTIRMTMAPPLLKQYQEIKKRFSEELLLFRMGDFYELFFQDAEKAADALGIALTSKPIGKERIPLAGIPVKAADGYIARLLERGLKVAICEQVGEARDRGLMEREVIEVITPGTVMSPSLLEEKRRSSIASWWPLKGGSREEEVACALCDVTTGDFLVFKDTPSRGAQELKRWNVKELLLPEAEEIRGEFALTHLPRTYFESWEVEDFLKENLGVSTLEGFGFSGKSPMAIASYALLKYLKEKKGDSLPPLQAIRRLDLEERMFLDAQSLRNLEITERIRPGEAMTLIEVIDDTVTPMGGRLLRSELQAPHRTLPPILERLQRVNSLVQQPSKLQVLRRFLEGIGDLERVTTRVAVGKGSPRDFIRIAKALEKVPSILLLLEELYIFKDFVKKVESLEKVSSKIRETLVDDPPLSVNEGGLIREGVDPELDELRSIARNSKARLLQLERKERARTGIGSLKIGYNSVFGYYIEVTKPNLKYVPSEYVRKQTLVNAERFITEELKELERKILGAEEAALEKEKEHLESLRNLIRDSAPRIQTLAKLIAEIDLCQSLANVARKRRYVMPEMVDEDVLEIEEGRHPVVEVSIGEPFIPNDTSMGEERIFVITGPNMSGKSTYLRQVALIVILAQIGSFVPASRARIGIVDRVFSRIGASDDLARGVSTFMAEMVETAQILNQATERSLVILDEVGRGTSTYDGMAIAWAVIEYLAERIRAKTLFATHYHELSSLEGMIKSVRNYTVLVREWGGGVVFLRKVVRGTTDRSYGVQVARLAGLPPPLLDRAKVILDEIESSGRPVPRERAFQLSFFQGGEDKNLRKKILGLNLDEMTPRQALEFLYNLKEEVER